MSNVVFSKAARIDRREITAYTVKRFGIDQARRLRQTFQAKIATLASAPMTGHRHEELDPPGRSFRYAAVMKWEMYPWDQDKTWGYYDGLPDDQVFVDMPLTFGMAGDRPPRVDGGGGPFGRRGRPMWWREGGAFSRPLLANPQFRKVFLARAKEILEKVYTEEVYFPLMDGMSASLEEDVKLRADASGRASEDGTRELARNVELLKTHLTQRRRFLFEQDEIRKLESETRAAAPAGR